VAENSLFDLVVADLKTRPLELWRWVTLKMADLLEIQVESTLCLLSVMDFHGIVTFEENSEHGHFGGHPVIEGVIGKVPSHPAHQH